MGAVPLASPRLRQRARPDVDLAGLQRRLRAKVRGRVSFDDGSRAMYATDASNYRQVPIGVVLPYDPRPRLRCAPSSAHRCCRGAGVPALLGSAATSRSYWTGRVTAT